MSRASGGFATADVRATAILQDYLYSTDPCTPGADVHRRCGRTYMAECGEPPCGFDRPKYLITALMAMFVVGVVIGLLNCFGLYIPVLQKAYGLGYMEICFTAALTYAILIKTTTLSAYMIGWVGHRNTALFGMILFFIGILLDAFTIHYAVFYVVNLGFFAIGGGLAYGSAMAVAGDLFRKNLATAMILVSIGSCLGTILFYWCNLFLLSRVSYRWTKLCLAMLVILFTGATHLFPSFMVDIECGLTTANPSDNHAQRDNEIKDCIAQAAKRNQAKNPSRHHEERSCMCVCVCDVALWSDWSFVLWGFCVLIATMALFVPYMFILAYAETVPLILSPWYITMLCIASAIGRIAILVGVDFTFDYKRNLFVGSTVGSGILWLILPYVDTFGWLVIWGGLIGIIEGLIVCCIPRLTLLTIPRPWIENSWGWILWFHAIGVFIITMFVAVISRELMDFFMAFTVIGILQIIGGLMGLLLPNEEDCEELGTEDCDETNPKARKDQSQGIDLVSLRARTFNTVGSYPRLGIPCFGSSFGGKSMMPESGKSYGCCCPICKATGCIPECPGCVPGELAGISLIGPCGGANDVNAPNGTVPPTPSGALRKVPCPSKSKTNLELDSPSKTQVPANVPLQQDPQGGTTNNPPEDGGVVKRTTYEIRKTKATPTQ